VDPAGQKKGALAAALGRVGEEAALDRYRSAGYRLVARNWRCPIGELDLVVARGGTLVFCEVKTRRGAAFGGPHESVTLRKQRKLRMLAEAFLHEARPAAGEIRIDVASVTIDQRGRPSVHVFEQAC
jgi:putative endonuclease